MVESFLPMTRDEVMSVLEANLRLDLVTDDDEVELIRRTMDAWHARRKQVEKTRDGAVRALRKMNCCCSIGRTCSRCEFLEQA